MSHYTFRVQGRGEFPKDMLRYDGCYGVGRNDRKAIELAYEVQRTITLIGPRRPTQARWESFGWKVIDTRQQPGVLNPPPDVDVRPPEPEPDIPNTQMEAW